MANLTTDSTKKGANGAVSEFEKKSYQSADQLSKMAKDAGEKIGSAASDFASTASEKLKEGRDYVEHNPAKGIAMAMGAGVVLGSLLTMALRSKR